MVEFGARNSLELNSFRTVNNAQGTLGLITLNNDVFLCTIILASQVATVRPGETVQRIHSVEFCAHTSCLWWQKSMLIAW
jgi:synaptojanin